MSPCIVPAILTPKKKSEWRMGTYSRAINRITIKYPFLLPWMEDFMDYLNGTTYFTNIDLKSGYHQSQIREGGEWKNSFNMKGGSFKWFVMPFGMIIPLARS